MSPGRPEEVGIPENKPGGAAYSPDPMQCEPTQLMCAAKRGDRDAFDRLVAKVRGQAFHVARGYVGSRDDALELSQEAFMKTYRARDTFREGELFMPWFHRILRNTCYSFLRKNGRLKKRSLNARFGNDTADDEADWDIEDAGPAPSAGLESDERAQAFWRGFNLLSARDREILSLRHFKELRYQAIADTLEIPIGTVMSRLFHARRRLREALGEFLEEDWDV